MTVQKTHTLIRTKAGGASQLRSDEVQGTFFEVPVVGKPFTFFADPLEHADASFRLIRTSFVTEVVVRKSYYTKDPMQSGASLTFATESGSVYTLQPIIHI